METPHDDQRLRHVTTARQLLDRRADLGAVAAARHVGGLQAQHPASPYLALWNRVRDLDPVEVDRAFADGELVKASLMRLTLHAVARDDLPPFRSAMEPSLRAAGFKDRRFTETGLTTDDGDTLVAAVADFATEPRSRDEIVTFLDDLRGEATPSGVWRALRFAVPWRHAPGPSPWSFADPARFVTVGDTSRPEHDDAVATLVGRYLRAFGPATVADVSQFTLLRRPVVLAALDHRQDLVRLPGTNGELFDLVDGERDVEPTASVRLLPMWDNLLLAYADRTRVVADEHRAHVIRRNGDVLASVLVDGRVCGVWRCTPQDVEVCLFDDIPNDRWEDLEREARALRSFLDPRDPMPYRRYDRWWDHLPDTGRRRIVVD